MKITIDIDEKDLELDFLPIDRSNPNDNVMFTPKFHKDLEGTKYYETGKHTTRLEDLQESKYIPRSDIAIINEKYKGIYTNQYAIYANSDGSISGNVDKLTEAQKVICLELARKLVEIAKIHPEFKKLLTVHF